MVMSGCLWLCPIHHFGSLIAVAVCRHAMDPTDPPPVLSHLASLLMRTRPMRAPERHDYDCPCLHGLRRFNSRSPRTWS